jgi:predicted metal-dependent TIM-barrel fold hydrolase
MVHTPHRDKKRGTSRSMDLCVEHGLAPWRVVIDHNNEETVDEVLQRGFWAAFTIYPRTKMGSRRMVEIVKRLGSERILVDSSADWGVSDPLAVPKTAQMMLESGISPEVVRAVTCDNARLAYGGGEGGLHGDWLAETAESSGQFYNGNTVLRGQDPGSLLDETEIL